METTDLVTTTADAEMTADADVTKKQLHISKGLEDTSSSLFAFITVYIHLSFLKKFDPN